MRRAFMIALTMILALFTLSGCGKKSLKYDSLINIMNDAVTDSAWPGGVLMIGHGDEIVFHEAVGYHTYDKIIRTKKDDIFDLASISKVIGTTSAVMKLVETGQLS
ncbi:MAG: beta-lactamase family protein, partial [Candidatus Marinimicrobia bacterium]|nr:beta-lactamase family protein [Candidatus Neomarinimicrobiota bacterium]